MRMNATDVRPKAWAPAVPRKIPDNIVSSKYTAAKVFIPSYEKESPRIERLLANDYQRIWLQERQLWDKVVATKIATKKILPRMLIKRKVPTCVTVKYLTRAEQLKEKKKKSFRQNYDGKSKVEEVAFAKHGETKLEKDEEDKFEAHDETKSEKCKDTKSKEHETRSEKYEKAKVEKFEKTESEKYEETQSSKKDEELKSKNCEEIESEKCKELENHKESKLENAKK
ncbi:hypothetical protein DMN91_001689 [Ooceraea biroi]|uniref:Uncharacterized protein n=2 Tax=Ooceraea biroi TaxID=2015173 RepID=A0A3L8DZ84_OOCBI|nr:uncharacterized protein LOC105280075 isoform X2 [Ooceraea biroi]RLU25533.1 hypothetical protein DMN91_001689 [Ooceraea biroi]